MKKKLIVIFIYIFISVISLQVFSQQHTDAERVTGWSADIDTLLVRMKQQHYVYKSSPLPAALLDRAKALKNNIAKYSDERMVLELERLMYFMHDGHSYIVPFTTKWVHPPS